MESNEDGKLVRVVEVNPVEIKCAGCNEILGQVIEELDVDVYCEVCFNDLKTEKEEVEENMNKIRELVGF